MPRAPVVGPESHLKRRFWKQSLLTSLSPSPLSSGSIPECVCTPLCPRVDTCWGCAVCDTNVAAGGGGSGFGTGGLSSERVLKKWGVGAGEPVWLSGQARLALGIFGTLQSGLLQHSPLGS